MTMNPYKAQQVYKTTSIQTASQGRLIIMLFEGAIRFINQFSEAAKLRKIEEAHNNSIKAQRIMTELILALDHSKGGDVSRVIERAYEDIRTRMITANIRKDFEMTEQIVKDLEAFKDAWNEIFRKVEVTEMIEPSSSAQTGVSIKT